MDKYIKKFLLIIGLTAVGFLLFHLARTGALKDENNDSAAKLEISEAAKEILRDEKGCFEGLLSAENCENAFSSFKERLVNCRGETLETEDSEGSINFESTLKNISKCFEKNKKLDRAQDILKFGLSFDPIKGQELSLVDIIKNEFRVELERLQLPESDCKNKEAFEAALKEVIKSKSLITLKSFLSRDIDVYMGHTESDVIWTAQFSDIEKLLSAPLASSDLKFEGDSSEISGGPSFLISGWKDFESPVVYFNYTTDQNKCVFLTGIFYEYHQ